MKKVLFASLEGNLTAISEFIPIAKMLEENGCHCIYLLPSYHKESVERLEKAGLSYEMLTESEYKAQPGGNKTSKNVPSFIHNSYNLLSTVKKMQRYIKLAARFFQEGDVHAIVVYGDRHVGLEQALIYHARKHNTQIIVPQVAINDIGFMVGLRQGKSIYAINKCSFITKALIKLYPGLAREYSGDFYSFYGWGQALGLKLFGVLPERPWLNGDSFASSYLTTFNVYKEQALAAGHQSNNIKVTGQVAFDQLHKTFLERDVLVSDLGIKYFNKSLAKENLAVFALPQFYEHSLMSREEADKEIGKLLKGIGNQENLYTLISLHPKMRIEDYTYIDEIYPNVKVLRDERLSEVLAASDFFFSCFLSTVPWAIMVNSVPVFLDYYNLNLDSSVFKGVKVLTDIDSYERDVYEVISDSKVEDKDMLIDHYIELDGRCGERILNEFISK